MFVTSWEYLDPTLAEHSALQAKMDKDVKV